MRRAQANEHGNHARLGHFIYWLSRESGVFESGSVPGGSMPCFSAHSLNAAHSSAGPCERKPSTVSKEFRRSGGQLLGQGMVGHYRVENRVGTSKPRESTVPPLSRSSLEARFPAK